MSEAILRKELRMFGVSIDVTKSLYIGLSYLYGIGRKNAINVCEEAGIHADKKIKFLTDEEVEKLRHIIRSSYLVEGELKEEKKENIKRKQAIGCFQGLRHRKGLPVRGQNTKNNAKTRKKRKIN